MKLRLYYEVLVFKFGRYPHPAYNWGDAFLSIASASSSHGAFPVPTSDSSIFLPPIIGGGIFTASLYPAPTALKAATYAIDQQKGQSYYVPRKQELKLDPIGEGREESQPPEDHDPLEYLPSLKIDLETPPKTSHGLVFGWHKSSDIRFPKLGVIYRDVNEGPRTNGIWVIAGDEFLDNTGDIIIQVTKQLQFQIVVKAYDIESEDFKAKVKKFIAGTTSLKDNIVNVDIGRPPIRAPTGHQTPNQDNVLVEKPLGKGSFATVKRENIVEFLGFEMGPPPELRFEYLAGGIIGEALRSGGFSTFKCLCVARQGLSAVKYLHELEPLPIIHRNISSNNILIQKRDESGIKIKLTDFGIAKEGLDFQTRIGTPTYFAPELFSDFFTLYPVQQGQHTENYSTAVDIWSLGAVIAEILCGLPRNRRELKRWKAAWCVDIRIHIGDYWKKEDDRISFFLLKSMLQLMPEHRANAATCFDKSIALDQPQEVTTHSESGDSVHISDEANSDDGEEKSEASCSTANPHDFEGPGAPSVLRQEQMLLGRVCDFNDSFFDAFNIGGNWQSFCAGASTLETGTATIREPGPLPTVPAQDPTPIPGTVAPNNDNALSTWDPTSRKRKPL
ncbi:CAMK protein kinase [Zalerion maritima]|uniref:CAMK protein kinase n=1 Tax=Zalerion maritima TaxID=339359 RepID=A0AAD5WMJ7_9PEZI|nr:CAMK protein kinase [Zalerion maritima]